jgi:uncharacterized coiled-coil DUF342 family protein
MSTEQVETPVAVETTEAAAAPAKGKEKRQRKAPEELYDLTKPIPKVDKPNKAAHDAEVDAINTEIDAMKEKKNNIQKSIELAINGGRDSAAGKIRNELRALRSEKGALINQKKALRAKLDIAKKATENLMNDKKQARANVRFGDAESIDKEIAKLKQRQETTSMSLTEEKKLLKEIDALQTSKQVLDDLKDKDKGIDDIKAERKTLGADISAKDKEIDAKQVEIDAKQKIVDEMKDTETEAKKNLSSLKDQRETIRKEIGDKIAQRNELRKVFGEENDKWYDYQRAIKAQKKMKYEEEKKKREEEKAAWLAAKEAEEAKKIPYEEEMYLCDYLANYLSKTYLEDKEGADSSEKKTDVVSVKDDPFAGFAPLKKNDDEVFLKMGAGKKARVRASKKKAAPVFKLNVDSFEQFGLLGLTPPTSLEAVQGSVDELKAKKEWYSQQERGAVPTASDIRKANEKAAQKLRQGDAPSKKNGKLDIASDDFVPLSAGGSSVGVNAEWGQKSADEAATEDA